MEDASGVLQGCWGCCGSVGDAPEKDSSLSGTEGQKWFMVVEDMEENYYKRKSEER